MISLLKKIFGITKSKEEQDAAPDNKISRLANLEKVIGQLDLKRKKK